MATSIEKSRIVNPFSEVNVGFDLFTNEVNPIVSKELTNTVSDVINDSLDTDSENELNDSIINLITTTINKELNALTGSDISNEDLITSIVNTVTEIINKNISDNSNSTLNQSIVNVVTDTINKELNALTGSSDVANEDLITSIVKAVTEIINKNISDNSDSTLNRSIVNVVTDTINKELGDEVANSELNIIDSITNIVSDQITDSISNNFDSEISQSISNVAQITINSSVDNITIEAFENKIRIKDSGISNLKLQNPFINFTNTSGVSFSNSQINMGDTLNIELDNTVLRTIGNQNKNGILNILDNTESLNSSSGCLILDGGLGIKKNIYCDGIINSLSFNATSDRNFKKDIKILKNSLQVVNKIECCSYKWKKNKVKNVSDKINYGVIAQQLEEIGLNFMVQQNKDYKSVNYLQLIPLMLSSIQEMSKEIENLKKIINN